MDVRRVSLEQRGVSSTKGRANARVLVGIALALTMACAILVGLLPLWTLPEIAPATAPPTEFSAERAMQHLEIISREPRPLGSEENARVREYLIAEIRSLGLEPEVQTTVGVNNFPGNPSFSAGVVHNIIVRLPGASSTGSIALDGHYDGAPTGPAASDCGSCVVSLLETLRALKSDSQLKNDVIFVFTDGEENQDLGAAAFNAEHPLAKNVRVAINFEAMGTGGPSLLYFTGGDDAWLVEEYARASPLPIGSSFVAAVVGLFPSQALGCDLEEYLARGARGLGFVYLGDGIPAYHTMRDSLATIDPRSVEHDGSHALALARHFGNLDLESAPESGDSIYFNLLPGVLVVYPVGWALPLSLLATCLLAGLIVVGFRRSRLTLGGLVVGIIVLPIAGLGSIGLAAVTWAGIRAANPNLQLFLFGNESELFLLGLLCLVVATTTTIYSLFARRVQTANLAAGALVIWTVLSLAICLALPAASYVFTWPLLFATLGLGWLVTRRETSPVATVAILSLAAAPGLVLVPQAVFFIAPLFVRLDAIFGFALGVPLLEVPLLLVALLVGLLVPQLAFLVAGVTSERRVLSGRRWLGPASALLCAVVLIALATAASGFDAEFPRPSSVAYHLDADSGEATWITVDRQANVWSEQYINREASATPTEYPLLGLPAYSAPAPKIPLVAPRVTVLRDVTTGASRSLSLRLLSPRGAATLLAVVEAPGELTASLAGKALDLTQFPEGQRRRLVLTFYGLPAEGTTLDLSVGASGSIRITLVDRTTGLPDVPGRTFSPRPAAVMPTAEMPDPTFVRTSIELGE